MTYIVIEGVIGVGKTALTRMLGEQFSVRARLRAATVILEQLTLERTNKPGRAPECSGGICWGRYTAMSISRRLDKMEDAFYGDVLAAMERITSGYRVGLEAMLEEIFGPGVVPLNHDTGQAFGWPELWPADTGGRSIEPWGTTEADLEIVKAYCERKGMDVSDSKMEARVQEAELDIKRGLDRIAARFGMIAVLEAWRTAHGERVGAL